MLFNKVLTQGQEVTWESVLNNFLVSREVLIPRQLFSLRLHEDSSLQFPTEKGEQVGHKDRPSLPWTCHGRKCPFNAMHTRPKGRQGPDVSESQCHAPYRIWLAHLLSGVYSCSTHLTWEWGHMYLLGMSVKWTERQLLGLGNRGTKKKMLNVLENTLASWVETASYLSVSSFLYLFFFLTWKRPYKFS